MIKILLPVKLPKQYKLNVQNVCKVFIIIYIVVWEP